MLSLLGCAGFEDAELRFSGALLAQVNGQVCELRVCGSTFRLTHQDTSRVPSARTRVTVTRVLGHSKTRAGFQMDGQRHLVISICRNRADLAGRAEAADGFT